MGKRWSDTKKNWKDDDIRDVGKKKRKLAKFCYILIFPHFERGATALVVLHCILQHNQHSQVYTNTENVTCQNVPMGKQNNGMFSHVKFLGGLIYDHTSI